MNGNRHFGKIEGSNEEVVILGYRGKTGEVLVCYLSALPQSESQVLRSLVMTNEAQGKDFLMDATGGPSVLERAHHPSGKSNWQEYLIRLLVGRNRTVRTVTLKDVHFHDQSQKNYFSGFGASVEPEVDRLRRARVIAQDAVLSGRTVPEPSQEMIQAAMATLPPVPVSAEAPAVAPAPAAPAVDPALAAMVTQLAQSQQAMLEMINNLSKTVAASATASKIDKPKRPYVRKAKVEATE